MLGSALTKPSSEAVRFRDRRPRFEVDRPIRYRPVGATRWGAGFTANISGTGTLFRSDLPLPVGVTLELEIALNGVWTGRGIIRATGHTVRQHKFVPPSPGVAVHFIRSSLVPPDLL